MSRSPSANGVHRHANSRCGPLPSPIGAEAPSTPAPAPSPKGSIPRNELGQFAKGYAGGPGNPYARRVAALRRAFHSVFTEEDLRALARVLLKQALGGDAAAAKLLLAYAIGKPAPADPDGVDFDELRLYRLAVETTLNLPSVVNALPPDVACGIVQAARPHIATDTARQIVQGLATPGAAAAFGEQDDL